MKKSYRVTAHHNHGFNAVSVDGENSREARINARKEFYKMGVYGPINRPGYKFKNLTVVEV